jgi:hypothetical protein
LTLYATPSLCGSAWATRGTFPTFTTVLSLHVADPTPGSAVPSHYTHTAIPGLSVRVVDTRTIDGECRAKGRGRNSHGHTCTVASHEFTCMRFRQRKTRWLPKQILDILHACRIVSCFLKKPDAIPSTLSSTDPSRFESRKTTVSIFLRASSPIPKVEASGIAQRWSWIITGTSTFCSMC